MTLIETNQYIA